MRKRVLVIDGERYVPVGDPDELKRRIRAAARLGGAFVSFATERRVVEVFVSAALSIRLEEFEDESPA